MIVFQNAPGPLLVKTYPCLIPTEFLSTATCQALRHLKSRLRTPGLKDQLLELEARQTQLKELIGQAPPPVPRLHPKLAEVYRGTVADLHAALNDPDARTEAADILRGLIERISVRADPHGHLIELTGDIVKLLTLPGGSIPVPFDSSVKVVAGHASTET